MITASVILDEGIRLCKGKFAPYNENMQDFKVTEKKITEIAQRIAQKFEPEKIILFGSWAWGTPHQDSDIDLFIIKKTDDTRQLTRDINGFLFPRLYPIDIIVYRPEQAEKRKEDGDFFVRDILTKGKILYAK